MKEQGGENHTMPEGQTVPFEQSLELARRLYAEFEPAIRANLYKEVDGVREYSAYPNLLRHFLRRIPDEELERYAGHGVTKTSGDVKFGQLAAVLNILATGKIKGDWAPLKNSGYIDAYISGPFLILSHRDENLVSGKKESIGAVVVNAEFYPLVEKLKELFPDTHIIRASELPDYMELENEKG
ncbi:MAG: hypothetical protein AAB699_00950 [Patescibacteria group bacterium]